jgi:hypothetical protein
MPLRPNGSRKPIAVLKVCPCVREHGIATGQFAVVKHDNAGSFCLRGSEPSRITAISKHAPPKDLSGCSTAVVAAIGCITVYWFVLPSTLMQRTLTLRGSRSLAYFNLGVVERDQRLSAGLGLFNPLSSAISAILCSRRLVRWPHQLAADLRTQRPGSGEPHANVLSAWSSTLPSNKKAGSKSRPSRGI